MKYPKLALVAAGLAVLTGVRSVSSTDYTVGGDVARVLDFALATATTWAIVYGAVLLVGKVVELVVGRSDAPDTD